MTRSVLTWHDRVNSFADALRAHGLSRAYIVTDPASGEVRASHSVLDGIAGSIAADTRDYDRHEGCFFELGRESEHLLSAHVHLTIRGQAAGGVRFWPYDTIEAFVRDGLRLSRGMGHKNALAGLWWGGGKGVIARREDRDHRDPAVRAAVYRDYGRFMSGLCGCYVTAEDAGTTPEDMVNVFAKTRHTTCIPPALGGSGNPSVATAAGVVVAMEAALAHLGRGDLTGKSVAMQGLGSVAFYMIGELLKRGVDRVIGADIDANAIARVEREYAGSPLELRRITAEDVSIFAELCDVLAPNAVGAVLNPKTIPMIRAHIVCGAANNQLEDPERDDAALAARGVLYVPDFLANRMGIVGCANEQYGAFDDDPAIARHLDREAPDGVYRRALEVLRCSRLSGNPPGREAQRLADELSRVSHPIWGHRGREIIDHIVASGWSNGTPLNT